LTIIEQLKRDEGLRLKPYKDSIGKLTIGIGRNLTDVGISEDEANMLLTNDIAHANGMLSQVLPWSQGLDDARLGALLNMTFNMGMGALLQFKKFLGFMQAGQWADASQEMLNSEWAKQVGSRAYRLSVQVGTGEWQ
jgi:lysozyme